MSKEYYLSDDYIIRQGVLAAADEIINRIDCTSINDMFYSFETIHEILAKYENKAKTRVNEQIRDACIYRYNQYKNDITENRRFLTADAVRNNIKAVQNTFRNMGRYELRYCIEQAYLTIDFVMRSIDEHITHVRNGLSRFYRIKSHQGKAVMIENDRGLTYVLDRETNKGFIGRFRGSDIVRDRTKTVSEDQDWEFSQTRDRDGIHYELV